MKIRRIKLNRLRNEEWFNFFTEFKTFVEQASPQRLNIEELFAVFLTLYGQADGTLEKIAKSAYTSVIVQLDGVRDSTFRGLGEAVKSASRHYDPMRREAAERLEPLFDHYGNLAARPFNEETSAIHNFIQELRGKYAGAVAQLDLQGWTDELERNNRDFETAVLERTRETAGTSDLKMLNLRRQTDRCYLNMAERIEAAILLHGEGAYADFVRTLNANIDRYLAALKRRGGKTSESEPESKDEL